MKKNTGCGSGYGHGHKACPPLSSDVAKARSLFTSTDNLSRIGNVESNVILGEILIQSLTEADFHLPSYARAIKNIEKNISLTQCKAIPAVGRPGYVKLFVEGIVHKNIQYVEDGYGYVKDYSIDIPFKAYDEVRITGNTASPFGIDYSVKENVLQRREIAKDGMGAKRCEFGSLTFEINNEPVECKLLASAVNQWDIVHHFDNWGRFNKVTEKMDIILAVQLSQKRPLLPLPPTDGEDSGEEVETVYDRFRRAIDQ